MQLALMKEHLRVTNSAMDTEISYLMEGAKSDLFLCGIALGHIEDEDDFLMSRAIVLYTKAHFGFDNKEHDNQLKSYNLLKGHLSLSQEYLSE